MAKEKWIQGAIKKPGALHKELGVPEGKKIPAKKLEAAAEKPQQGVYSFFKQKRPKDLYKKK